MAVGIAGEEGDTGDVRQEEQVRPLDGGVVAQSHLRERTPMQSFLQDHVVAI